MTGGNCDVAVGVHVGQCAVGAVIAMEEDGRKLGDNDNDGF